MLNNVYTRRWDSWTLFTPEGRPVEQCVHPKVRVLNNMYTRRWDSWTMFTPEGGRVEHHVQPKVRPLNIMCSERLEHCTSCLVKGAEWWGLNHNNHQKLRMNFLWSMVFGLVMSIYCFRTECHSNQLNQCWNVLKVDSGLQILSWYTTDLIEAFRLSSFWAANLTR